MGNPLWICSQPARREGALWSPELVTGIQNEGSLVGDDTLPLWVQCKLQVVSIRIAVSHVIRVGDSNCNLHMSLDKWTGPKHLQCSLAYSWCSGRSRSRVLHGDKSSAAAILLASCLCWCDEHENCFEMSKRTHVSAPAPPKRALKRNLSLLY